MQLGGEEPTSLLDMGGAEYALKKLRRWKGEGQTERKRKMARFLINHGSLSSGDWSYKLSEHSRLLIDLALEWDDSAMWEEVLEKSTREGHALRFGLEGELVRALNVFTFDRIENVLVHSTLAPIPLCSSFLTESRSLSAVNLKQVLRSAV